MALAGGQAHKSLYGVILGVNIHVGTFSIAANFSLPGCALGHVSYYIWVRVWFTDLKATTPNN